MPRPALRRPAPPSEAGAEPLLAAVDRAIGELRRGGSVVLHDGAEALLVAGAETTTSDSLARLRSLGEGEPLVALTAERGRRLGLGAAEQKAVVATCPAGDCAAGLRQLADPLAEAALTVVPKDRIAAPVAAAFADAAIELTKLARLLPAAILGPLKRPSVPAADWPRWAAEHHLLAVRLSDVAGYQTVAARTLAQVAEARVPLADAEDARILAFRPADGGVEHLAILIGTPDAEQPVLTRLHSECLTGDLLGSLRCDCGDQLRGAIAEIGRAGSGVLLYLAQEGRGIGLVNKLRAYRLQDRGADTLEANQQLGFEADERVYLPAAEMLRQLGFSRVRLMTNNPEKVAGLARCGIEVVERVPHVFPANRHNDRYLETKATRFGHLL